MLATSLRKRHAGDRLQSAIVASADNETLPLMIAMLLALAMGVKPSSWPLRSTANALSELVTSAPKTPALWSRSARPLSISIVVVSIMIVVSSCQGLRARIRAASRKSWAVRASVSAPRRAAR